LKKQKRWIKTIWALSLPGKVAPVTAAKFIKDTISNIIDELGYKKMLLEGIKIGFGLTGSFCTIDKVIPEIEKLVSNGAKVFPILSGSVSKFDTRFGRAEDLRLKLEGLRETKL